MIINTYNRTLYSLNGKWRIIIDPYECGYYDSQYKPKENGYFKDSKPKNKSDLIEYNFDDSDFLDVPGDWNSQDERLMLYEGTVWYKKNFDYHKKGDSRLFLYFGSVNYHARVYINGLSVGEHEGGFTPFYFEITDIVRKSNNIIVVKVDNKRLVDGVPTVNTDWWNYGGLTRHVMLIECPKTFIEDYFIQLEKGSMKQIWGWIKLNGDKRQQKVTLTIPEVNISETITTNTDGYVEIHSTAKFELWSPENPKLYEVIIKSESDTIRDWIGFRCIETRGTDLLLNGNPLFLRGISIHEEAPIRGGRACTQEDAQILLGWAKDLNCNFIRLAHYPHNEFMLRLADRLGLLVWAEIPVYWTISWKNSRTYNNTKTQLTEMIMRDKNRASIILWSLSNETPISDERTDFLKNLAYHARSLDPTRLLTAALNRQFMDEYTIITNDPLGEYIDVVGYNEYIGWYNGLPEKCDQIMWKTIYDKPHIMSEFGGGALYGYHGDTETRWTEEYQEYLYKQQINMLKKIQFLRGMTPWILMDFRSPRRSLPGIQDFWNRKGLISNRGEKKKAFYVLQTFYKELKRKK